MLFLCNLWRKSVTFCDQFNYVYHHVCHVRSCSILHSYDWICVQLSSPISIFLSSVKSVVGLYIGVNERTNEKRYPFLIYEDKYTMECDFFLFNPAILMSYKVAGF